MAKTESEQEFEVPMPEPQEEHMWLQKLIGEWEFEGEMMMAPGHPSQKYTGKETVKPLGDLWILAEGRDISPGEGASGTSLTVLGYDTDAKRFIGIFVVSIMTHMWIYHGELDSAGKKLTLDTEGPGGKGPDAKAKFKDAIEVVSDDHRILTSRMQSEDGQWHQLVETHYHRVK